MHDWTLLSAEVDWETGNLSIRLRSPVGPVFLYATGISQLNLPRRLPLGPSVSINGFTGPAQHEGLERLLIEMQSGDDIEIIAASFELPTGARQDA